MSLRIIEWDDFLDNTVTQEPSAMTIGVFDGIHLGHRELIKRIVSRGPNPTIVTFKKTRKKLFLRIHTMGIFLALDKNWKFLSSLEWSVLY